MKQTATINWVPVAEGLPPIVGSHLIQWSNGTMSVERSGLGSWSYMMGHGIVAWAPLPEPYRAEKEGNND